MQKDFRKFAIGKGITSSYSLDQWEKAQDTLYQKNMVRANFTTPNIIERSTENMTHLSVIDKLATDRILFVGGVVNEVMATILTAQLLYLDDNGSDDIVFYLNSPGGSVSNGLTIVDMMNYVSSKITTVNTGMAASMGSVILSNGEKGSRFSLPNSKVMIHKVSFGAEGHIDDINIVVEEGNKENAKLFKLLSDNTNKSIEELTELAKRDYWLDANESLEIGIIDGIIKNKL